MRSLVKKIVFIVAISSLLAACSTRQTLDKFQGSTEQRLVTHSINQLMNDLPEAPLKDVADKKVFLQTHFIKTGALFDYATSRLKAEVNQRWNPVWVDSKAESDYLLEVFFTSLGTDQDSFGLSIPLPLQGEGTEPAKLTILSFEMFHGISEMYLYLTDLSDNKVASLPTRKVEVRTDKIATPIITIPVNTMD